MKKYENFIQLKILTVSACADDSYLLSSLLCFVIVSSYCPYDFVSREWMMKMMNNDHLLIFINLRILFMNLKEAFKCSKFSHASQLEVYK